MDKSAIWEKMARQQENRTRLKPSAFCTVVSAIFLLSSMRLLSYCYDLPSPRPSYPVLIQVNPCNFNASEPVQFQCK